MNTQKMIYLQREEKKECFYAVISAVNKITEEEIVSVRYISANLEQFD